MACQRVREGFFESLAHRPLIPERSQDKRCKAEAAWETTTRQPQPALQLRIGSNFTGGSIGSGRPSDVGGPRGTSARPFSKVNQKALAHSHFSLPNRRRDQLSQAWKPRQIRDLPQGGLLSHQNIGKQSRHWQCPGARHSLFGPPLLTRSRKMTA